MYVRMFTFIGALPGGGSSGSEGASKVPSLEFLAGQIQELSILLSDLAKEMLAKGSTNSTGSGGGSSSCGDGGGSCSSSGGSSSSSSDGGSGSSSSGILAHDVNTVY